MKAQRFQFNITCRQEASSVWDCYHQHDEIELKLGLTPWHMTAFNERLIKIDQAALILFWGNVPHRIVEIGEKESRHCWITIPLGTFLRYRIPESFVHRILGGEIIYLDRDPEFDHDCLRFKQWGQDLSLRNPARERCVELELEARLIRLAFDYDPRTRHRYMTHPGQMDKVFGFIAKNYQRATTVDDIADAVGLHPKYLITQFRKYSGIGPMTYINQLRVAHAKRLLLTSNDEILSIADESGFGSVSSFYAVFKKISGASPAAYRKSLLGHDVKDRTIT